MATGLAADPPVQALIDRVRAARADKVTLDIRGGASKAFYGETPLGEPLDMAPLAGISCYEPSELVVTVRAGTPLAELEAVLAEKGQCLAFEPPRFADLSAVPAMVGGNVGGTSRGTSGGTVGGMVAAGLAGPSRACAGSVRDHVLGATLLSGRAEVMAFGGQVMKNVAGYDVSRLLAGSMGTLGAILQVSLKVLPLARAVTTLRFECEQAEALKRLNAWGGRPLPLNASAWWSGVLVLRLAGAAAAVRAAATQLGDEFGGEEVEPALAATFWAGMRDHSDEFFAGAAKAVAAGATLWRLSVPQTAAVLKVSGEHLVEWGGAQRWVVTTAAAATLREAAARVGGHATVFRGDKSAGAFTPLSPTLARIQRQTLAAFDPDGVFNRSRLYPEL